MLGGDERADYLFVQATPDGRGITFVQGGRVVFTTLEGGNQKFLTTPETEAWSAHMSPDGKWVVYGKDLPEPRLFRVPVDGREPVQLSDKQVTRPAISPDGRWVACSYRESNSEPFRIALLPFAGGPPIKIFDASHNFGHILRCGHDWRAIYYVEERAGVANIWRLPVNPDGPPTRVTNFSEGVIYSFAWSRDGEWLARGTRTSDVVLITDFK